MRCEDEQDLRDVRMNRIMGCGDEQDGWSRVQVLVENALEFESIRAEIDQ